jgi:hypothetical protein
MVCVIVVCPTPSLRLSRATPSMWSTSPARRAPRIRPLRRQGVVVPGFVVVGVGVVVVWVVVVGGGACPGTVAAGDADPTGGVVVAVGVVSVIAGGATAGGGAVWTTVAGVVPAAGGVSSLVSFTNANASIAPATRTIAPIATVGSCQFGVGARRVRAGAPHSRHQS